MSDQSKAYRIRAIASEQRAASTVDPLLKKEWEEIAIHWHMIANLAAQMNEAAPKSGAA